MLSEELSECQILVPLDFWSYPRMFIHAAHQMMENVCEKMIQDTVPQMISYLDSATLLAAATVSHLWREIATRDEFWQAILKVEFSLDSADLDPPILPIKRLWLHMRRGLRALLTQ